jgi:microcystin-dependent protein
MSLYPIGLAPIKKSGNPIGAYVSCAYEAPPVGALFCDGRAVSRSRYKLLFAKIGTTYGSSAPHLFNLPDRRGLFERGFASGSTNDPDRATRTARGDGATGDRVGTKQADDFKSHNHANAQGGGLVHTVQGGPSAIVTGYFNDQPTSNTGGTETRPINISALAAIWYRD